MNVCDCINEQFYGHLTTIARIVCLSISFIFDMLFAQARAWMSSHKTCRGTSRGALRGTDRQTPREVFLKHHRHKDTGEAREQKTCRERHAKPRAIVQRVAYQAVKPTAFEGSGFKA